MTVFEIQIDPERNAVIRRALAKRIVHQRELEEEEASTEEDESFLLGSPITITRKGASPSPSPSIGPSLSRKEHRLHLDLPSIHPRSNINNGRHPNNLHINHTLQPKQHIGRQRSTSEGGGGVGLSSLSSFGENGSPMNIKNRWKTQYLRATTASPSGSVISMMSEALPDIPPVILPDILLNDARKISTVPKSLADVNMTPAPVAIDVATTAETAVTAASESISAQDPDPLMGSNADKEPSPAPPKEGTPGSATAARNEKGPDAVEQVLLTELEELKKEKSRLFSLFRAAIQKKEETPPLPSTQPAQPTDVSPTLSFNSGSTLPPVVEEESLNEEDATLSPPYNVTDSQRELNGIFGTDRDGFNMKDDPRRKPMNPRRPSDQDYDKRAEPSSRPNFKRREHERVIDRSKLNLEIPRKPSIPSSASASSNSTASTPTPTNTGFTLHHHHPHPYHTPPFPPSSTSSNATPFPQKGKRQRSISPPAPYGPSGRLGGGGSGGIGDRPGDRSMGEGGGRGSGAGSFGSSYSDSNPSNKYPRADYNMGLHGRNHSNGGGGGGGGNSNGGGNHHSYNGLPEKPQVRHPNHHHHHPHGPSHSTNLSSPSTSSHHGGGDDGYQRGKHGNGGSGGGPPSYSNLNGSNNNSNNNSNNGGGSGGGGNNGVYRQGGPIGYPPPTRIGFGNGNSNGGGGHNDNNNNNGGGSGNNNAHNNNSGPGGGGGGGRGGYYGHGDGGGNGNNNGGVPISKFGPPSRPLPFNRNMMHMSHARGMGQNRNGFGGGRTGGNGGGNGGGPLDRSMSSGRPGDWSRRRSRT